MELKADHFNRLRDSFAGKGVLLSGGLSSAVERLCYYFAYNMLRNKKKESVVWISTDYSYRKVVGLFKEYGFDITPYLDRFLFVDLISLKSGADLGDEKNVKYVQDPGNLTELSLAISDYIDNNSCGLVVINMINGLLIYNELERAVEFIRIVNARAFENNFTFLSTYIEGEHSTKSEMSIKISVDVIAKVGGAEMRVITPTEVHPFSFELKKGKLEVWEKKDKLNREQIKF